MSPSAFELRLLQNIADALEAGGQRFEILRGPDCAHGFEALFDVDQIVPAGGEDGVDFVVLKAANFAEVVADAVGEEFFELAVAFAERLNRQPQFAFDQNLDDALRGAAQRERILRAGRESGPTRKQPRSVSSLSAMESSWPACVRGIESSMLTGL